MNNIIKQVITLTLTIQYLKLELTSALRYNKNYWR